MNQDGYFEEALKMRNLLQVRYPGPYLGLFWALSRLSRGPL